MAAGYKQKKKKMKENIDFVQKKKIKTFQFLPVVPPALI